MSPKSLSQVIVLVIGNYLLRLFGCSETDNGEKFLYDLLNVSTFHLKFCFLVGVYP